MIPELLGVFLVGAAGGFLGGLLGIGGGVIVVPALVFIAGLSVHQAAGTATVQVVVSSITALWQYSGQRTVDARAAVPMGAAAVACAFIAGFSAQQLPAQVLTAILAGMVSLAMVLLTLRSGRAPESEFHLFGGKHRPSRPLAAGIGGVVGSMAGLLGLGGGFLVVPTMNAVLRMPLRVSIPSSLVVVACITGATFLSRLVTNQLEPIYGLAVTAGAMPMAFAGSRLGRRASPRVLRSVLFGVLLVIEVRLVLSLILD